MSFAARAGTGYFLTAMKLQDLRWSGGDDAMDTLFSQLDEKR
jgi:hypothetical protein